MDFWSIALGITLSAIIRSVVNIAVSVYIKYRFERYKKNYAEKNNEFMNTVYSILVDGAEEELSSMNIDDKPKNKMGFRLE